MLRDFIYVSPVIGLPVSHCNWLGNCISKGNLPNFPKLKKRTRIEIWICMTVKL